MIAQREKAERFRALHEAPGAFVIPNPWDAGSARLLEGLGFLALATTSSGFAQSLGRLDGSVTLEEKLAHCRALSAATAIPVSADLENGFADEPAAVARTIVQAAEAGVVGGSIEDWSGSQIYDFEFAVERVRAAAEAAHSLPFPFTLTARAENLLRGKHDLGDTIRRLEAYAGAGADVLYAPGLKTLDELREVCRSVDKPVNVLAPFFSGTTLDAFAAAGAKRVSIGGALADAAIGATLRAGREMLQNGSFGWLAETAADGDVENLLGRLRNG